MKKVLIAFTAMLFLISCGTIVRKQIVKSFKKEIEGKNHPFPYHIFNKTAYEALIVNIEPATKKYLNDAVLNEIESIIHTKYAYLLKVAREGVNSTDEILNYMANVGILNEMGITKEAAFTRINNQTGTGTNLPENSPKTAAFICDTPKKPVVYKPEYEPISSVMISFPIYYPLEWKTQAQLIKEVSESAEALVLVPNQYWQQGVVLYLSQIGVALNRVKFIHIKTDDVWTRDYGPTTVLSGKEQKPILLWNHYVQSYTPYQKADVDAGLSLGAALGLPVYRLPLVIEGGNILTAGDGMMVMFASALYNNPDINLSELKKIISDYFGCKDLILFPSLKGELTGHIDMVVKFINKGEVMVIKSKPNYKWHHDFEAIADSLSKVISSTGRPYSVHRIDMPETKDSEETFYSYVNSLIVNDKVIVPLFSNPASDEKAIAIYKQLFPAKKIVGIHYDRYPVGSVHCQTKDIPAFKK